MHEDLQYAEGFANEPRRNRLDLYVPGGVPRPPLVMFVHGGVWTGGKKEIGTGLARALSAHGIACACINTQLFPFGKPADMVDDYVPAEEQHRRLTHLIDVVRGIATERHQRFVGTTQDVLVEDRSDSTARQRQRLHGRTPHNVKVNFEGDAQPGEIIPVDIVHATSESMLGRQVVAVARD